MDIESAFTAYLLSYSSLTALIARRFFFEEIPQNTAFPAVTCIKISDVKDHILTGQSELERPMYQFTVFALTKASAKAVTNQLKAALCDYSGTMVGITIQHIRLENELSNLETTSDGTMKVYTESLEFQINYIKE